MRTLTNWVLALAMTLTAFTAAAQNHSLDSEKTYVFNKFGNSESYAYANGSTIGCSAFVPSMRNFYWQFIATDNDECYYIRNASTGQYVQSTVITVSTAVQLGENPVEFQLGHDTTAGAATNSESYWYMAATGQAISVEADGTLGLNFGSVGGEGTIVAYYIKSGRGNSYWEITEKEMPTEPTESVEPGEIGGTETIDPAVVTSLDQIVNGKIYTMASERSFLYGSGSNLYTNNATSGAGVTTADPNDERQQFAIMQTKSGYYIYNVSAKKYLTNSTTLTSTPSVWKITENAATAGSDYRWMFSCKGNYINTQIAGQQPAGVVINSWSTPDAGNRLKLTAVAEADVTALINDIEAAEEDMKKPVEKPLFAQRLGLVRIPCGILGAYLNSLTMSDYSYTHSGTPSAYNNFPTTEVINVTAGKEYALTLSLAGATDDTSVTVFFDWNADGVYETQVDAATGAQIQVPADAVAGHRIMRVRITDNGMTAMDNDFEGSVYDFRVAITATPITDAITQPVALPEGVAYDLSGRRTGASKGVRIENGKKILK